MATELETPLIRVEADTRRLRYNMERRKSSSDDEIEEAVEAGFAEAVGERDPIGLPTLHRQAARHFV